MDSNCINGDIGGVMVSVLAIEPKVPISKPAEVIDSLGR
jgi:hypothetical protein